MARGLLPGRARAHPAAPRFAAAGCRAILDLNVAVENSRLNQTYNTPALATLWLLAEQVEWMNAQGGLDWAVARCDTSAAIALRLGRGSRVRDPVRHRRRRPQPLGRDDRLRRRRRRGRDRPTLRHNGIVDVEPYRKLGRNQLRIALFPAIEPTDVEALTACIDWVVGRLF